MTNYSMNKNVNGNSSSDIWKSFHKNKRSYIWEYIDQNLQIS